MKLHSIAKRTLSLLCAAVMFLSPLAACAEQGGNAVFGVAVKRADEEITPFDFVDWGNWLEVAVHGEYAGDTAPQLLKIDLDSAEGIEVLEAWTVDGLGEDARLALTAKVIALPEDGASPALYGVKGNALGDMLQGDLALDNALTVDLGGALTGIVLARPVQEQSGEIEKDLKQTVVDNTSTETELPGSEEAEQPTNEENEQPGSEEAEQPANEENEQPGSEEAEQPANEENEQPGNEEAEQPGNEESEQPGSEEAEQPTDEENEQPGSEEGEQAGNEENEQPGSEEAEQPTNEENEQPGSEEAEQPANEENEQPAEAAQDMGAAAETGADGLVDSTVWANDAIYLTGHMPEGAVATAEPVTLTIEGADVIAAYNITIYVSDEVWTPAEDSDIQVHFIDSAFGGETVKALAAYRLETAGAQPELVSNNLNVNNDEVVIESPSFTEGGEEANIFAVVKLLEKDVEAWGQTYHVAVTFGDDARIPVGAWLKVTPVEEHLSDEEAARQMGAPDDAPVMYARFLDIAIMVGEEEIEPAEGSIVNVSIELRDVDDPDMIQVVHMDGENAKPLDSSVNGDSISFETDSFSKYGFYAVAQPVAGASTEQLDVQVLGGSSAAPTLNSDNVEFEEGVDLLDAFTVSNDSNSQLWMSVQRTGDINDLGSLESVALYSVSLDENNAPQAGEMLVENMAVGDSKTVSLQNVDGVALVRDSGLRRDTLTEGDVTVEGMVPKQDASLEVTPAQSTVELQEGDEPVASVDIAIKANDELWQPNQAVRVEWQCPEAAQAVAEGHGVELWHVHDGEQKPVDFKLNGDTLSFEADGFSEYTVVKVILNAEIAASDGNTYNITVSYDREAGLPMEGVELRVTEVDANEYRGDVAQALGEGVKPVRGFDITIVKDGVEYHELNKSVEVKIELAEGVSDDMRVVHIGDAPEAMETVVQNDALKFASDRFSIYIITEGEDNTFGTFIYHYPIAEGETVAVGTVNKDDGSTVTTAVENGQVTVTRRIPTGMFLPREQSPDYYEERGMFAGWYTSPDCEDGTEFNGFGMVIEERTTELWAKFTHNYQVEYVSLPLSDGTTRVLSRAMYANNGEEILDTARDLGYVAPSGYKLVGWTTVDPKQGYSVKALAADPTLGYGLELSLDNIYTGAVTHSMTLYPIARKAYWVSFDANGGRIGNTTKASVLLCEQETYQQGLDELSGTPITRTGYTLVGWKDAEGNDIDLNSNVDTSRLTLRADWEVSGVTSYRLVFWKENVERNTYDIGDTVNVSIKPDNTDSHGGETIRLADFFEKNYTGSSYEVSESGMAYRGDNNTDGEVDKYFFLAQVTSDDAETGDVSYGFEIGEAETVIKGDGSSVINLFYDRKTYTFEMYPNTYRYRTEYDYSNYYYPAGYLDIGQNVTKAKPTMGDSYGPNGTRASYTVDGITYDSYRLDTYTCSKGSDPTKAASWKVTRKYVGDPYTFTVRLGEDISKKFPSIVDLTNPQASRGWESSEVEGDVLIVAPRMTVTKDMITTVDGSDTICWTPYVTQKNVGTERQLRLYKQDFDGNYPGEPDDVLKFVSGYSTFNMYLTYSGFTLHHSYNRNNEMVMTDPTDGGIHLKEANPDWWQTSIGGKPVYYSPFYYTRNTYGFTFDSHDGNPVSFDVMYDQSIENLLDDTNKYYDSAFTAVKNNPARPADLPDYYELEGWYTDEDYTQAYDFANNKMPAGGVTVYAKWAPRQIRVSIDRNAGEGRTLYNPKLDKYEYLFDEYSDIRYNPVNRPDPIYAGQVTLSALMPEPWMAPEWENHVFLGWESLQVDEDGKLVLDENNQPTVILQNVNLSNAVTENLYLRARWLDLSAYRVKYVEGTTEWYGSGSFAYGAMAPVENPRTDTVASNEGYFRAWQAEDGTRYQPGDSILLDKREVVLTAVIDPNLSGKDANHYTFYVEVDEEGDEGNYLTVNGHVYKEYYKEILSPGEILVNPAKPAPWATADSGKLFTGWYTESGRQFNEFGVVEFPTDTNLFAGFEGKFYVRYSVKKTVANVDNWLVVTVIKQDVNDERSVQVKPAETSYTPDGSFDLIGWSDVKDASEAKYVAGQEYTVDLPEGKNALDLYPVTRPVYYVTFDTNGGTYLSDDESVRLSTVVKSATGGQAAFASEDDMATYTHGGSATHPLEKTGYEFAGWRYENGNTYQYSDAINGDTTVYAHWIATDAQYRVVFWKESARQEDLWNRVDSGKAYDESERRYDLAFSMTVPATRTGDEYDALPVGEYAESTDVTRDEESGRFLVNADIDAHAKYEQWYSQSEGGSDTTISYFEYAGYDYNNGGNVLGDNSTVLNVYFNRKPYNVVFHMTDFSKVGQNYLSSGVSSPYPGIINIYRNHSTHTYYYSREKMVSADRTRYLVAPRSYANLESRGKSPSIPVMTKNGRTYGGQVFVPGNTSSTFVSGGYFATFEGYPCEYVITMRYEDDIADEWPALKDFTRFQGYNTEDGVLATFNFGGITIPGMGQIYVSQRDIFTAEMLNEAMNAGGIHGKTIDYFIRYDPAGEMKQVQYWFQDANNGKFVHRTDMDALFNYNSRVIAKEFSGYDKGSRDQEGEGANEIGANEQNRTKPYIFYYRPLSFALKIYNNNGGTALVDEEKVKYGKNLAEYISRANMAKNCPADLSGFYSFDGWYTTPECFEGSEFHLENMSTMPNHNLEIYGKWMPTAIEVELDLNDGAHEPTMVKSDEYGGILRGGAYTLNQVLKIADAATGANQYTQPTRDDGFEFVCWSDETGDVDAGEVLTQSGSYKVKWRDMRDYVLVLGNEEYGHYSEGTLAELPEYAGDEEHTGAFSSWNTKADGTGLSFYPGENILVCESFEGVSRVENGTVYITLYPTFCDLRKTVLVYDLNLDGDNDPATGTDNIIEVEFQDYMTDSQHIPNSSYQLGRDTDGNLLMLKGKFLGQLVPGKKLATWRNLYNHHRGGELDEYPVDALVRVDTLMLETDENGNPIAGDDTKDNVLIANWEDDHLPVKAVTYENGDWQNNEPIEGSNGEYWFANYSQASNTLTMGDENSGFSKTWKESKGYTHNGYTFAFARLADSPYTAIETVKYEANNATGTFEWKYYTGADDTTGAVMGTGGIVLYYYANPAEVPVHVAIMGPSGLTDGDSLRAVTKLDISNTSVTAPNWTTPYQAADYSLAYITHASNLEALNGMERSADNCFAGGYYYSGANEGMAGLKNAPDGVRYNVTDSAQGELLGDDAIWYVVFPNPVALEAHVLTKEPNEARNWLTDVRTPHNEWRVQDCTVSVRTDDQDHEETFRSTGRTMYSEYYRKNLLDSDHSNAYKLAYIYCEVKGEGSATSKLKLDATVQLMNTPEGVKAITSGDAVYTLATDALYYVFYANPLPVPVYYVEIISETNDNVTVRLLPKEYAEWYGMPLPSVLYSFDNDSFGDESYGWVLRDTNPDHPGWVVPYTAPSNMETGYTYTVYQYGFGPALTVGSGENATHEVTYENYNTASGLTMTLAKGSLFLSKNGAAVRNMPDGMQYTAAHTGDKTAQVYDDSSQYVIGGAIYVIYNKAAYEATITKTWEDQGVENVPNSITLTFQKDDGTTVKLGEQNDPRITVNQDGTVTLSKGNGDWSWTLNVPNEATKVQEIAIDGYLPGSVKANLTGEAITVGEESVPAYTVNITNTRAVCKVTYDDGNGKRVFYKAYGSLTEAFADVCKYSFGVKKDVQIEMLVADYALTDTAALTGSRKVTLTTAGTEPVDGNDRYSGPGGRAVIRRGNVSDDSSMIKNFGELVLGSIVLDGEKDKHKDVSANGGIVNNEMGLSVTVTSDAVLRNSATSGKGGAIYGSTVNIEGGTITGNEAAGGAAVYVEDFVDYSGTEYPGILNLTGGAITGNRSDNGAVSVGTNGTINISDAPTVTDNTRADGRTACNVYIGAADTIQVTGPINGGSIGVYATDDYKDSGEPFARYDVNDTAIPGTLNRFVNDRTTIAGTSTYLTGMDGTDGVAVWQMAKLTVEKVVTGGMGDTSRNFSFTLTLTGDTFRALKAVNDDGTETNTVATFTANEAGGNQYMFTLKHGASEQLYLPLDRDITIAEADAGNYTTTIAIDGTEVKTATNRTVKVTLESGGNKTVTFTNDLPTVSPTGVDLRYAPYVLMLLAGIALIAVMVKRKKQ